MSLLDARGPVEADRGQYAAGDDITRRSYAIIRSRLALLPDGGGLSPDFEPLAVRIAHTTGDVPFSTTFEHSAGAVEAGVKAIRAGRPIVVDVGMVKQGVRVRHLPEPRSPVLCLLDEPETASLAADERITRSAAAIRRCAPYLDGAVVAIGNAPTALFELLAMAGRGLVQPALIIGVPVGFVGALESKVELYGSGLPFVTNRSERGGSPIAAAIVNGIVALASGLGDL